MFLLSLAVFVAAMSAEKYFESSLNFLSEMCVFFMYQFFCFMITDKRLLSSLVESL